MDSEHTLVGNRDNVKMSPVAFMNKGIKCFSCDVVLDHMRKFYQAYGGQLPIISVGSGIGAIEYLFQIQDGIMITCVDPNPMSYAYVYQNSDLTQPFITPHYSHVGDLIAECPDLVGHCLLFLNWCEPNQSKYDYDAIRQLQPVGVLTIIERFLGDAGCAGGQLFHNWMDSGEMTKIHESILERDDDPECLDVRIVYLGQDSKHTLCLPEHTYPIRMASYAQGCVIA